MRFLQAAVFAEQPNLLTCDSYTVLLKKLQEESVRPKNFNVSGKSY